MKAKAPTRSEISANMKKALENLAQYGRKKGDPELDLVIQCLSDIFQGSGWTELPDGIHRRKEWAWGLHLFRRCTTVLGDRLEVRDDTETRLPYKAWPELDWDDAVDGCASDGGELRRNTLINQFMACVILGDCKRIHRIAEAVKKAHERMRVASRVSTKDAKPELAGLVAECKKYALPSLAEGESVPTTKDQTIRSGYSETVVKEVRRAYGLPPDKRGPKPKAAKPTVQIVSTKNLKAAVTAGAKQFWAKRKKRAKPGGSNRPSG
jgi:hypothetical protein